MVSMSSRAISSRTAGQPWLRPRRPSLAAVARLTYGAPCTTMARSSALSFKSRIEPAQAQRVAVAAHVGAVGDEEPQARHVGAVRVREARRVVVAAPLTVRDQLAVEHAAGDQIQHPQPRLGGRPGVVDHREEMVAGHDAAGGGIVVGGQRGLDHRPARPIGQPRQVLDQGGRRPRDGARLGGRGDEDAEQGKAEDRPHRRLPV